MLKFAGFINFLLTIWRFRFIGLPEFLSVYQWKDPVYVFQISSENGPHSNIIYIFRSDMSEAQMFCVPFNNFTVLTGLGRVNGKRPYIVLELGEERILERIESSTWGIF